MEQAIESPAADTGLKNTSEQAVLGRDNTIDAVTAIAASDDVNKVFSYDCSSNKLTKKAKATIGAGVATVTTMEDAAAMVDLLKQATARKNIALCLGAFHGVDLDVHFGLTTKQLMEKLLKRTDDVAGVHDIDGNLFAARVKEGIDYSSWILLDADSPEGMPADQVAMDIGERIAYLESLVPGLGDCMRIELRASSARVRHSDDAPQKASHALLQVSDPGKIDALRSHIQVEMVMQDMSFHFNKHSKSDGSVCGVEDRTVFDLAVLHKGRLIFVSEPSLDQSAIDAGYVVDDADIRVVNPDGGVLDISKIKLPSKKVLKAYSKKTKSKTTLSSDGKSIQSVVTGKLKLDTQIERRGECKTLEEWLPDIDESDGLRCETPFRESCSEAGWLHMGTTGKVGLYDHAGVEYPIVETPVAVKAYGSNIPENYTCCDEGVFDTEGEQITRQPVYLESKSRPADTDDDNWKIHIEFMTEDGNEKTRSFPKSALVERNSGNELVKTLANSGLDVLRGKSPQLLDYLSRFENVTRKISVNKIGWHGDAFILPYEIINEPAGEKLVLDDRVIAYLGSKVKRGGSLEAWMAGIADVSPIMKGMICAGFTPALVEPLQAEAGGWNLCGGSTGGKTTTGQMLATVWGIAGDPQKTGGSTMIQSWNSTANAALARAEMSSGVGTHFDELATTDPRTYSDVSYTIYQGQRKGRSQKDGSLQQEHDSMTVLFTSGELSTAEFIKSGGLNVKAGQLLRTIDMSIDHPDVITPTRSAAESLALKELAITHYGWSGPELLKRTPDLRYGLDDIDAEDIGEATTAVVARAREKFKLVLHAGYLAIAAKVVPWTREEVLEGVQMMFTAWVGEMPNLSEGAIGARKIQAVIQQHEARFEVLGDNEHKTHNRIGWFRDDMYHFPSESFKKACSGSNFRATRKELDRLGLLHVPPKVKEKGGYTSTLHVPQSVKVTSVKSEIIGYDF